jgi:hypothetical protein
MINPHNPSNMKIKQVLKILTIISVIAVSCLISYTFGIGNQELRYGKSGYPKNCRALITDNIRGFEQNTYTAEEALKSIDRNCGQFGLIWSER